MKKVLLGILTITLVASLAWVLARPRTGHGYPTRSVDAVFASVAATSGADIVEMRRTSGQLRAKSWNLDSIDRWLDGTLGRPVFEDLDAFLLTHSGSTLRVVRGTHLTETGKITIYPDARSGKLAEDFRAAFVAAFPKIRCKVVSP